MSSGTFARLADHRDFQQLIRLVAENMGLLPIWIEKDYWVVRVLDALVRAPELGGQFVFKGGTSLSKAWKLIDRFSEDVDLLLTGPDFGPMPERPRERADLFKAVRTAIERETPLRLPLAGLSEAEKRQYYLRADTHGHQKYPLRSASLSPTASSEEWLLVEAGFRGGARPQKLIPIRSHMGEYLADRPELAETVHEYVSDIEAILVPVLAAERTFVEKLLAVHTAAIGDRSRLQVRHYYDLAQLYRGHADVQRSLEDSQILASLLSEAIEISNTHWGAGLSMATLDLRGSPALDPPPDLRRVLEEKWRGEEVMYPRGQPPLAQVLETIAELRFKLKTTERP